MAQSLPNSCPNPCTQTLPCNGAPRLSTSRGRLFHAPAALRLWHLASLDAPSVALVWSLAFAWSAGVRLQPWVPLLLVLAVWAVYVADRLLDARAALGNQAGLRDRHHFHWRHRRLLLPLAVAAAVAAGWIVFHLMPAVARQRDSLLAAASLAYLAGVHSRRRLRAPLLSKEFLVGLLFTLGCALPAWSRAVRLSSGLLHGGIAALAAPTAFFSLLAWINCRAIDRWESHRESASRPSIAAQATLLGLAALIAAALQLHRQPRSAALLATAALAALLLAELDRRRSHLTPLALRAAADLVLLAPLLLLPLRRLFP